MREFIATDAGMVRVKYMQKQLFIIGLSIFSFISCSDSSFERLMPEVQTGVAKDGYSLFDSTRKERKDDLEKDTKPHTRVVDIGSGEVSDEPYVVDLHRTIWDITFDQAHLAKVASGREDSIAAQLAGIRKTEECLELFVARDKGGVLREKRLPKLTPKTPYEDLLCTNMQLGAVVGMGSYCLMHHCRNEECFPRWAYSAFLIQPCRFRPARVLTAAEIEAEEAGAKIAPQTTHEAIFMHGRKEALRKNSRISGKNIVHTLRNRELGLR